MPVDKMDSEMFVYGQAKECRPTADRQQPELENCDVWEQLNRLSCDPCLPVRYLLPTTAIAEISLFSQLPEESGGGQTDIFGPEIPRKEGRK